MILHSPLTIIERHHHSFDPFPDNGRVLPFGSGATVFYNYVDYQFKNNTDNSFQIRVWLSDKHIKGEIRCKANIDTSYHVYEKNHKFVIKQGIFYRSNEIWIKIINKKTGLVIDEKRIISNFAEVKYIPNEIAVVEES